MTLALLVCSVATGCAPTISQESSVKPNFVFILTDDMRKDDLKYMPETRALLGQGGMQFQKAFVSLGHCCPSRATIMRGQYAHNHGVWFTSDTADGGWQGYKNHGNEQDNIATRLHGAGYRTGLFGKYLNFYNDATTEPAGWDDWFAKLPGSGDFDYDINDNGTKKHFGTGESDYFTDVLGVQAREFIDASVGVGKPFFAYVAPNAPHEPAIPAPRHENAFDGEQAPRLPSFNESDVSDKPPWIRSLPPLGGAQIAQIDARHESRVESLQAVDELVKAVVGKLQAEGALDNTYVVFTSDNGWHHGEHRIPKGKAEPYEESIHMPLLIRGPGVQAGSTTNEVVLNTDYFPTFTDLAGVRTPAYVDGRSLRPLLQGSVTTWRTAFLLESRDDKRPNASFYGIRTRDGRKYIEYMNGFQELYDLETDPYELDNSYDSNSPPAGLTARLQELKACAGVTCRAAEDGAIVGVKEGQP